MRKYLQHLADALPIREFRRFPLSRKVSAKVPAKITLTDLGVRNALLRGAPSLWESDPSLLGPAVETLVQGNIRDHNLAVHYYREHEDGDDRSSPVREVDFVAERTDAALLPLEVKFRRKIDREDSAGVRFFQARFGQPLGVIVTRELSRWDEAERILYVPLQDFPLAF